MIEETPEIIFITHFYLILRILLFPSTFIIWDSIPVSDSDLIIESILFSVFVLFNTEDAEKISFFVKIKQKKYP